MHGVAWSIGLDTRRQVGAANGEMKLHLLFLYALHFKNHLVSASPVRNGVFCRDNSTHQEIQCNNVPLFNVS